MDESELWEILNSYKGAIDALVGQIEALNTRINDLEGTVMDDILTPVKEMFEEDEKEARFNEWHGKHGEILDPYNERLRAIEGADFDLSRQAFEDYNGMDEEGRPDEDEYVHALTEKVEKQLEEIRAALGADKVEAKVDEGGVELKADEQAVDTAEEEPQTMPEIAGGEVETNPEELAAFEKELEAYKA